MNNPQNVVTQTFWTCESSKENTGHFSAPLLQVLDPNDAIALMSCLCYSKEWVQVNWTEITRTGIASGKNESQNTKNGPDKLHFTVIHVAD